MNYANEHHPELCMDDET
jgi:hypothetical protein